MRTQIYKKGNTFRNNLCIMEENDLKTEVQQDDRKFAIGAALGFTELTLVEGENNAPDAGAFLALTESIYNFLKINKNDSK